MMSNAISEIEMFEELEKINNCPEPFEFYTAKRFQKIAALAQESGLNFLRRHP